MKHLMLSLLALTLMAGNCGVSRNIGANIAGQAFQQSTSAIAGDLGSAIFLAYRDFLNELMMIGEPEEEEETETPVAP